MAVKPLFSVVLCAGLALAINSAHAGSDSGVYIGGAIASASIDYSDSDPNLDDVNFEDDDTGYKVYAGYNFGLLPLIDVAVEFSYLDLGTLEDSFANSPVKLDTTALSAAALGGLNFGPLGLFGKVGVVNWDTDVEAFEFDDSASGTDPYYGVGAKIQLASLAVRAEYEVFELDDADIDYFSLGASITF
ncbi:porin family protein [Halioxenophilus aromaticivorans]|uniref:Outer membrane protein beta-barrel domain-containing protein n=1 Tax=Halioxenophilus aromaticivorans TaxID=1306992 RepID=A0AAV3UAF7_9ALTE